VAACQRYFQKSYQYTTAPGTVTDQGPIMAAPDANVSYKSFPNVIFPTIMRAPTTITIYNPTTGVAGLATGIRNGATNANQPIFLDNVSTNGFASFVNNSATSTGNQLRFHYTASSEL